MKELVAKKKRGVAFVSALRVTTRVRKYNNSWMKTSKVSKSGANDSVSGPQAEVTVQQTEMVTQNVLPPCSDETKGNLTKSKQPQFLEPSSMAAQDRL